MASDLTHSEKNATLDVLHEQVEWAVDRAHDRANSIDAKSAAVFTASSFLLAGMAALQVAIIGHVSNGWEIAARVLGGGVALCFVVIVRFSLAAMWPRKYTIAPEPEPFITHYHDKSPEEAKQKIMASRVENLKETNKTLDEKTHYMKIAFWAVCFESVLLVIILVIASISL